MHRVHGWELLRRDGALGRHGDLRRRTILTGLCLGLHELLGRTVSSECRLSKLHELPHGHLPWHHRCVVVVDLRGLHGWKLLRHDGTLSSHSDMCRWAIFDGLCLGLYELF